MSRILMLLVPLVVAAPAAAQADTTKGAGVGTQTPGVVVFFGHGEQIFDVGPLPELGKKAKKKSKKKSKKKASKRKSKRRSHGRWLDGYRSGYRCQVFLLFWSYVHRWGCKPCVFQGKTYLRSAMSDQTRGSKIRRLEKAIGKQYKLSDHKLSWWGKNGRWVVGGVLLLLIISGIIKRMRRRRY